MTTTPTITPPPPAPPSEPPTLSPRELSRWAWRQLTSMRTALVLLFLLAVAAVPGSVVPQQNIDALAVTRWKDAHPTLTPLYEKLGLFSVFGSVWFSAVYILLMVSLVGCVVPRLRLYWRALRARPPRTPRNLGRLPESRTHTVDEEPGRVLERATSVLRRRRFRVERRWDASAREGSVAAERGYLREAGNLLFHSSVLLVLVGFAVGNLWGYQGGVIVVGGHGFANSLSQYDDFDSGAMFDAQDLPPFSFKVNGFHVSYLRSGEKAGMPTRFSAPLTYRSSPSAPPRSYDLRVNHPLSIDGSKVFLVGHGYAPRVTVRDGHGDVAFRGPVVFLPQDSATFESFGAIKAPDAAPDQLGFEGLFLPTYAFTMARGPFSAFPDDLDPRLSILAYHGDLGLDSGKPQSVYTLDKHGLSTFKKQGGAPLRLDMSVGQTKRLPDGAGTITFNGVDRWVKLQVSTTPATWLALLGVALALLGLMGSLFIRPRRTWVRVTSRDGRTVVELAGLDRSSGGDLRGELDGIEESLGLRSRREPEEDA